MQSIEVFDNEMNETASYTLQNHGIPYFGHTYSAQIEDTDNGRLWEDTNEFSVLNQYKPSKSPVDATYFVWTAPDGLINLYKITSIKDMSGQSASGVLPYTTFSGVNKLAYDLSGVDIEDRTWVSPTLREVAEYILGSTGWTIGNFDEMGLTTDSPTDFAIDGADNAQDAFNTMITSFSCEVRGYITVDGYGNIHQMVDIVKHLQPVISSNYSTTTDESTNLYTDSSAMASQAVADPTQGRTIEYHNGLAGFERTQDWTTLYTRIMPINQNGSDIKAANGNSPYVVDQAAQNYWLGPNQPYRTLKMQTSFLGNLYALKQYAQAKLPVYNHPAFTYTITTAFMNPDEMPTLGSTNYIANFDVQPVLTVLAEVIQVEIHDDAPTNNQIVYGEYRTLNPTTPAYINAMRNSLASAIAKAQADASSIQPNILYPDGLDFSKGEISKRLILQANEGSTNISAYIDSKGFDWQHLTSEGVLDKNWSANGYLLSTTVDKLGTMRGQIDGGYIMNDPEVKIDDAGWQKLGQFDAYKAGVDRIMQHLEPLSDGSWLTSRATSGDDCTYVHQSADFSYVSKMTMQNGGHGTSFGVRTVSGKAYVLACFKTSGGYDLIQFPYTAGATLTGTSAGVTHLLSFNHYIRVNYDVDHDLIGITDSSLNYEVLDFEDVLKGVYNVKYRVNMQDYGYDIAHQIYQSQVLDFPYMYWQTGNTYEGDTPMVYAVNLVHQGQEFKYTYDFVNALPLPIKVIEPEGLTFAKINGVKKFIHSFNTTADGQPPKIEQIYATNIIERVPAKDLYTGTTDDSSSNS